MIRPRIALALAASAALASCTFLVDTKGLSGDEAADCTGCDASLERVDGLGVDVVADTDTDTSADASKAPCPSDGGKMVRVQAGTISFCVDATEVTNAHYLDFLLNKAPSGEPSGCAWNVSFVPAQGWPPPSGSDDKPVTHLDWCDAFAYCVWVKKRLCGKIGGGSNAYALSAQHDPKTSQWHHVCTHNGDGAHKYPYGNTYQAAACNGAGKGVGGIVAVASQPGCVGGYPGVFDMSGNAAEWTDECVANPDTGDGTVQCAFRGGGFTSTEPGVACSGGDALFSAARSNGLPYVGFRCCAD